MKKIIIISILLSCSFYIYGQKNEEINLMQADSTWGKEIIKIPFWFAPKINYKGHEDIRFAKGWEEIDSASFWTLVFVWDMNLNTKPTIKFFEDNIKLYFNGLMKVVNEDKELIIPKTNVFFLENETKNGTTTFTGTVETYDAFTTKKMIALQVTIESYYCKKTKRYIPLFRFSPKDFKHAIWKELNNIKLRTTTVCDN
ncbi:MAG: hypothetical protein L3J20_03350 [Flavobacteriaceae bacterium]|nr:hypothetical protein [Flavobacteriaceae bacterium]